MIEATRYTFFIELDQLRRQKKSKECSDSSIRFIELAPLELSFVKSDVEVNLFLAVGGVSCEVVVDDVFFLCQLQEFKDVVQVETWLEDDEEVNISMNLLLW